MTIREYFNRRSRRGTWISIPGFVLAVIGFVLNSPDHFPYVGVFGAAVFIGGIIYSLSSSRCPRCKKPFGRTAADGASAWSIAGGASYCPYCGLSFDVEYDEKNHAA